MPIHIFDIFNIFDIFEISPGSSGGPMLPAFQANVPNQSTGVMDDVAIGVGGLTELRDGSLWVEDYQGIYQEFGPGEVARSGGRVTGAVGSRQVSWKDENGDPLPAMPYVVSAPQATNLQTYSHTAYDQWNTVGLDQSYANDAVGLEGDMGGATTLSYEELGGTVGGYYLNSDITDDSEPYTALVRIKKDSDQSRFPAVRVRMSGGTTLQSIVQLNTATGEYAEESGGVASDIAVLDAGLWWVFGVTVQNNATGNDTFRAYSYGSKSGTFGVGAGGLVSGSSIFGNTEVYRSITAKDAVSLPPIFTDSVVVTRPTCALSFDAANHDDAEGTYLLEVEFGTNGQGIFSDFLRVISTNIRLNDGSNFADVAGAVDTPHKIGIVYGAGTMRLNVDGVWSVDTAYDGSLPDGVLDLFRTSAGMNDAGMIERYAGKDESIVDAWMAE